MLNEDISKRNLNFESYKERITNFSQEFELGLFLFILRRSLIWITLCVLTALASALIYLRYTAPTYEDRSLHCRLLAGRLDVVRRRPNGSDQGCSPRIRRTELSTRRSSAGTSTPSLRRSRGFATVCRSAQFTYDSSYLVNPESEPTGT